MAVEAEEPHIVRFVGSSQGHLENVVVLVAGMDLGDDDGPPDDALSKDGFWEDSAELAPSAAPGPDLLLGRGGDRSSLHAPSEGLLSLIRARGGTETAEMALKLTVPFLAALLHITAGALFVAGAVALHFPAWYGLAGVVVLESNKETWFDPLTEGTPNGLLEKLKEGAVDFAWWIVGSGAAFGFLFAWAFFRL